MTKKKKKSDCSWVIDWSWLRLDGDALIIKKSENCFCYFNFFNGQVSRKAFLV